MIVYKIVGIERVKAEIGLVVLTAKWPNGFQEGEEEHQRDFQLESEFAFNDSTHDSVAVIRNFSW